MRIYPRHVSIPVIVYIIAIVVSGLLPLLIPDKWSLQYSFYSIIMIVAFAIIQVLINTIFNAIKYKKQ